MCTYTYIHIHTYITVFDNRGAETDPLAQVTQLLNGPAGI